MKTFFYFLLMFAILTSCKKDQTEDPHALVGTWILEKIESKPLASGDDSFAINTNANCNLGNQMTFYSNGKMSLRITAKACNNNTPSETTGTWKVNNNTITFTYNNVSGEYYTEIVSIDDHSLVTTHTTGEVNNRVMKQTYSK